MVIVSFIAGWCSNSNRNGHVLKRLYDKYHERGLGAVVVTEYSDADEVRIHINRIGIDYPVVIETTSGVIAKNRGITSIATRSATNANGAHLFM